MNIIFRFPGGRGKALTLSYDDGRVEDRRLVNICNKYGIKGTFHINSGLLGQENYITTGELKTLYNGHEVALHTSSHPFLTDIPMEQVISEVQNDRLCLEGLVEYPIKGMSYPYGAYNDDIISTLKKLGIVYSRTVNSTGAFDLPQDFLKLHPTCHHNEELLKKTKEFLQLKSYKTMKLFYVWGHSYEFANDDNWGLLEEFFKRIEGNDDIWFATNIEIYRYISELGNLEFSADSRLVYNPSCITLNLSVEGEIIEIGPGQRRDLLRR